MSVLFAFLLTAIASLVECKVYERCELARELKHVHKVPGHQIATWVCIAKHESTFNTSAVNRGSGDHGLFQISDLYWCSPPGNGYACNAPCSAFEDDDITDDIACIRRIFKEHSVISGNGFNAWAVYPLYCKQDVSKYIEGCFDNDIDSNGGSTTTVSPDDYEEVYEFPPLPKPPKKNKKQENKVYEFPAISTIATTEKSVKAVKQNQILTFRKAFTTSKPFSSFSVSSYRPFSNFKLSTSTKPSAKTFSFIKQDTTTKPFKVTSLKSFTHSSSIRSKPAFTRPFVFQKSTTIKPLSFVYENVHSDHKREQKLFGVDKSEYSFLWKTNGFRLVRN